MRRPCRHIRKYKKSGKVSLVNPSVGKKKKVRNYGMYWGGARQAEDFTRKIKNAPADERRELVKFGADTGLFVPVEENGRLVRYDVNREVGEIDGELKASFNSLDERKRVERRIGELSPKGQKAVFGFLKDLGLAKDSKNVFDGSDVVVLRADRVADTSFEMDRDVEAGTTEFGRDLDSDRVEVKRFRRPADFEGGLSIGVKDLEKVKLGRAEASTLAKIRRGSSKGGYVGPEEEVDEDEYY